MRKLRGHPGRGALAAALLLALAAFAGVGAEAQSGRKKTPPQTQPPPAAEPQGESESESQPRPTGAGAALSFVVMEQDDGAFGADSMTRGDVMESFTARLGRSASVSVTRAGRGSRGDATKRAKGETAAHVVLLVLEDDFAPGGGRGGQSDRRSLIIRTYVYAPQTGSLKFTDTVYQRAARQTVGVGGVRLPVPTRTIGRYPSQLELRQAAQDAADRVLSRFKITPPPDNP